MSDPFGPSSRLQNLALTLRQQKQDRRQSSRNRLQETFGRLIGARQARLGREHDIDILGREQEFAEGQAGEDRQLTRDIEAGRNQLSRDLPGIQNDAELGSFMERVRRFHGTPEDPSGVKGFLAHELALRQAGSRPGDNPQDDAFWVGVAAAIERHQGPEAWDLSQKGFRQQLVDAFAAGLPGTLSEQDKAAVIARFELWIGTAAEEEVVIVDQDKKRDGGFPAFGRDPLGSTIGERITNLGNVARSFVDPQFRAQQIAGALTPREPADVAGFTQDQVQTNEQQVLNLNPDNFPPEFAAEVTAIQQQIQAGTADPTDVEQLLLRAEGLSQPASGPSLADQFRNRLR